MKQEKFKVVDHIRTFIKSISLNLDNFPKKEYELKDRIKKNSYDMLEIAYEANSTEFIELKINLINKMLAKVKVVDYLLDLAVDMEFLTKKKYLKLANRLSDIEKYSRGWMEQSKKSFTTYKSIELVNNLDATTVFEEDNSKYNSKLRSEKRPDAILLSEDAKRNINQIS